MCFIEKSYTKYFKLVDCINRNVLAFRINHSLFGSLSDILLLCVYILPFDSPFYAEVESFDSIQLLMRCILDLAEENSDCDFMLCGDFNARTGGCNTNLECDIYDTLSDPFCVIRLAVHCLHYVYHLT